MGKKTLILLLVIFCFGYFLRVMYLPQLALTFGYDQARDAIIAQQIVSGDIKILGPPASTPGLYHGVFYYYLLTPAYLIGSGSPIVAAYWIAFINALTIVLVFYLAFLLTKKLVPAYLSALFFAVSFESTQYAVWLSNPTIAIFFVPLTYLGLWMWIKEKSRWAPVITGVGLGLSIQAEVFLLYHAIPVLIWLFIARKKITFSQLQVSLACLLASVSTMIIAEIKFGFKSITGVTSLLSTQEAISSAKSLGDFLVLFLNQLGRVFAFSSYPGNIGYGSVFVLCVILYSLYSWNKKDQISWQPFLATWLFSHITIVSVGGTSTPFLLVGIAPAVSILLGITIYNWWTKQKFIAILLIGLLMFGNISMIIKENPRGQTIFAIQKDMLLSKQLKAIDYTYEHAEGEMYSVNSLTSPMWINIVWTYLYEWYGNPRHGYVPEWHGRGQEGQVASLEKVNSDTSKYFLIIEPMAGIPMRYLGETISEEDSRSTLVEERYFGELRIQERIKIE